VSDLLITPYGGALTSPLVSEDRAQELISLSNDWESWSLTDMQFCDLELLLNGGFSPLSTFLSRLDYESVCRSLRLCDGTLWPIPIMLDISPEFSDRLAIGDTIALRDQEGVMLESLAIDEMWAADPLFKIESKNKLDCGDCDQAVINPDQADSVYISGKLEGVRLPIHYDFPALRIPPAKNRAAFEALGWTRVISLQTQNLLHQPDIHLSVRTARDLDANLLIQPIVDAEGSRVSGHFSRVRCFQAVIPHYPTHMAALSLLPYASRKDVTGEVLLQGIISRNYGCTHSFHGEDLRQIDPAQHHDRFTELVGHPVMLEQFEEDLGITLIPYPTVVYSDSKKSFFSIDDAPEGDNCQHFTRKSLRTRLATGGDIPDWYTYPEIMDELIALYPPRHLQGLTLFMTGLSGSGKSTIARTLEARLLEIGGRPVTLLDGDIVRRNLSSELGFSRAHRDLNVRRIGFVASEITKNGGIAICAPIAPFNSIRLENRTIIESAGGYQLIYISTPLEVCESRDRKGLYARARAGIIKEFTGISDPYEEPVDADVVIDTTSMSPEEAADWIITHLEEEGYLQYGD